MTILIKVAMMLQLMNKLGFQNEASESRQWVLALQLTIELDDMQNDDAQKAL